MTRPRQRPRHGTR